MRSGSPRPHGVSHDRNESLWSFDGDDHAHARPEARAVNDEDYRIVRPVSQPNLAGAVVASLEDHIEFHLGEEILDLTLAPATRGQRAVYSCSWYEFEVVNGGHDQFFGNSTGILWEEAIAGFDLVGASQYGAVLKAAVALFPLGRPALDRRKRWVELEVVSPKRLEQLDEDLYRLTRQYDLDEILTQYIEQHPEDFFIP